jgi:GT2 family glycosyltransferase
VDVVVFGGLLLAASVVRDVGVPTAGYFMMCEELEYCLRVRAAGYPIMVLPQPCTVALHVGSSPEGGALWRSYYQTRNQLAMSVARGSAPEVAWWLVRQAKFAGATVLHQDRKRERLRLRALGAWHGLCGVSGRVVEPC